MKTKVFCYEGEWHENHQNVSVKPLFDLLEHVDSWRCGNRSPTASGLQVTYRPCQNSERLRREVEKLDARSLKNTSGFTCLYFAFHGDKHGLYADENEAFESGVSFDELTQLLGTKAEDRIVFFSSCGGKGSTQKLAEFKHKTGAKLVVGYAAAADWLIASMFELWFFNQLLSKTTLINGHFANSLRKQAEQSFFKELKVQVIY